ARFGKSRRRWRRAGASDYRNGRHSRKRGFFVERRHWSLAANLSQESSPDALWQTKCCVFAPIVSVRVKSKIRYNGQEYSSPAELPPEVRAAYEQAVRGRTAGFAGAIKKRFVINGEEFANEESMPTDVRK